jgi:ribose transport system ATP-binding protein
MVYIAADRAEALLMQRSVRENISLPSSARIRNWGWINLGKEKKTVDKGVSTLQIDARAGAEVRRLSGGNQQKVTIARWVAEGVTTMLCFDPTRGIDIRTKSQIYILLRDLATAGAAVLLYTSELKEIQLACDRVVVIFGGEVVAEMPAAEADEAALLRAAHNLKPGSALPEQVVASTTEGKAAVEAAINEAQSTTTASQQ